MFINLPFNCKYYTQNFWVFTSNKIVIWDFSNTKNSKYGSYRLTYTFSSFFQIWGINLSLITIRICLLGMYKIYIQLKSLSKWWSKNNIFPSLSCLLLYLNSNYYELLYTLVMFYILLKHSILIKSSDTPMIFALSAFLNLWFGTSIFLFILTK